MSRVKTRIYVYADWIGLGGPKRIGVLSVQFSKGRVSYGFSYEKDWLKSGRSYLLDPDLQLFGGLQFPNEKENFGMFLDSMPDSWGRTLMKRKAAQESRKNNQKSPRLLDIDYLLGVYDLTRMGGLRFKTDPNAAFLAPKDQFGVPPRAKIRDLQYAVNHLENENRESVSKDLEMLMAPGSSLGGARPKANILGENKALWIAKFPSKNDSIDKAAWEYLTYKLAINAGIEMAPCEIKRINGRHHTFLTKRFDRLNGERIHFASAMTMTGNTEQIPHTKNASYLDIVEFIEIYGAEVRKDLKQLWRRIIFNISVSNTDDHLRNHGFLLTPEGWILSPAYDLNPSIDKDGLALSINENDNSLDFQVGREVGAYFRLDNKGMDEIISEVLESVSHWRTIAKDMGISRKEQDLMSNAFKL